MPRILLVEDDTDVRLVFVEILFDAGFEVDATDSYDAAVAILESGHPYDLLITDGGLPDGAGTGLIDIAAARNTRSILVTGYPPEKFDGAKYTVLAKPIRPAALLAEIERVLGRDQTDIR
jgi:CheY-like chemotaxis protein